jgi:hypothetical protein
MDTTIECCPFWKKILGLCEHCEELPKGDCNE